MVDLSEKFALVLGGTGGIGRAVIDSLLSSGLKGLGVIDIVKEEVARECLESLPSWISGTKLAYRQASVDNEQALGLAMKGVKHELGGLHLIINAAGILNDKDPKMSLLINYVSPITLILINIQLKIFKFCPDHWD